MSVTAEATTVSVKGSDFCTTSHLKVYACRAPSAIGCDKKNTQSARPRAMKWGFSKPGFP